MIRDTTIGALQGSFGSGIGAAAAARVAEVVFPAFEAHQETAVVERLQSRPTRDDEMKAQRVLTSTMVSDEAFRARVENGLNEAAPGAVPKAKEMANHLVAHPQLVQDVAEGRVHFSRLTATLAAEFNWTDKQAKFYETNRCPKGGEDLPLFMPVRYFEADGKEASMFTSGLVRLPRYDSQGRRVVDAITALRQRARVARRQPNKRIARCTPLAVGPHEVRAAPFACEEC